MPQNFLQNHRLYLTPLSPLHLGTGEDYEPTNYVIEDGVLYVFDPAQAVLTPLQRTELLETAKRGDITAIQSYFKKHLQIFADCAYKAIGVSKALEQQYQQRLGKIANREQSGKKVNNNLEIECTAINPLNHQPYIPGSAFKGCLRTAVLERLSRPGDAPDSRKATQYENSLLGSFASDGLRLLKTADFMPVGNIATQIQYATNHKKKKVIKDGREVKGKGVTGRRETIQHGQYRTFTASCTLQKLLLAHNPLIKQPDKSLPKVSTQPQSLQQLAQDANRYHLLRFKTESQLLDERGLVAPDWLASTRQLLDELLPQLNSGNIMLVRLGKHGGAESKTLNGLAQIKIMQGKGQKTTIEQQTKTVWLAAQAEAETHGLLPFGWALVEIDPSGSNPALQRWCEQNQQHLTNVQAIQAKLAQRKQAAAKQKAAITAAAEAAECARAEQAAAEQAAQQARVAELAAMKPADRLIADWAEQLQQFPFDSRNETAAIDFFNQLKTALGQAVEQLDNSSKQQIAAAFSFKKLENLKRGFFVGKREKEIKAILKQLRGE